MRVLLHVKKQIDITLLQLQDASVTKLGISPQNKITKGANYSFAISILIICL